MNTLGLLRDIKDSEIDVMREWRNAPAVRANMYTRHEIGAEEHRKWWEQTCGREDRKYFMYEQSGEALGIVGFSAIDRANANCSWSFFAAPSAPKGTGSRMEFLALDYAFSTLQLHKIHCEVLAFNTAVVSLHKKFGFQEEGLFRQHHRVDGEFVDIHRLGLLASEWAGYREAMLQKLMKFEIKKA